MGLVVDASGRPSDPSLKIRGEYSNEFGWEISMSGSARYTKTVASDTSDQQVSANVRVIFGSAMVLSISDRIRLDPSDPNQPNQV